MRSIVSKWYSEKTDYAVLLNSYHQAFKDKFKRGVNKNIAQRLEQILREIKAFNMKEIDPLNDEDMIEGSIKKSYYDLINTTTSLLEKGRGSQQLSSNILFRRTHGKYNMAKYSNADDIFEQEFAALVTAVEQWASNIENPNINYHLFGTKLQSTSALNYIFDKNGIDDLVLKQINGIAERVGSNYRAKKLEVRQGKTDIKGIGTSLIITKTVPPIIEELFTLLQGHTFSVKNYSSYRKNQKNNKFEYKSLGDLDIGFSDKNSNLFKGVTGPLAELGLSDKDQISFFIRGGNHILGIGPRNSKTLYPDLTQQHWEHLRLIYEIRGSGLINEDGTFNGTDFIIWNDPGTENIAVTATDDLLYEILFESNKKSGLFSSISLTANQIQR